MQHWHIYRKVEMHCWHIYGYDLAERGTEATAEMLQKMESLAQLPKYICMLDLAKALDVGAIVLSNDIYLHWLLLQ